MQIIQEEMRHPMLTREDVTYWFCRYRMLDTKRLEERRRLIDGFVNSVIVYDEYIVITFNYKEGTTTVPFSKLDSSDLSSVGGPKVQNPLLRSLDFFVWSETRTIQCGEGLTEANLYLRLLSQMQTSLATLTIPLWNHGYMVP